MSDRTRGSRSGGGSSPRGSRSHRPSGSGRAYDASAWDDTDDYGDYRRGERRSSSSGRSSARARRYDDSDEYDEYDDFGAYDGEDEYGERRGRGADFSRGGGQQALVPAPPRYGSAGGSARARGGSSRDAKEPPRTPSRAWMAILAVLLVVIAIALIGVLVVPGKLGKPAVVIPDSPFATLTPGATPTVDPNFKAFQSDRSKYTIVYPQAWNATSDQRTTQSEYDYIDTFALQNAPSRLVIEQAGAFSAYTDQQIIQNEAANAQQNGVTFTKSTTQTPTQKIGGATWTRVDYSVNANGNPVNMVIFACHHSGRGYVIVLVSTAAEFGNDDQSVFEPMLASFRFA